jgi:hypothetical protein
MNQAGDIVGVSKRFGADASDLGESKWSYSPASGTTTPVGLYDAGHTDFNGYQLTVFRTLNKSGQVAGYSTRYDSLGYAGLSAWVYDGSTTRRAGLVGLGHTDSTGFQYSDIRMLNESGQAIGISGRYLGNAFLGQSGWFYDDHTDVTHPLVFSQRPNGFAFTDPRVLNDDGSVFGWYEKSAGSQVLGVFPFYWSLAEGFHELGDLVAGGLGAAGLAQLTNMNIAAGNGPAYIAGQGRTLGGQDLVYLMRQPGGGSWLTSAGGEWGDGANWSLGHQPTFGDDAVLGQSVAYAIRLPHSAQAHDLNVAAGDVTLEMSGTALEVIGAATISDTARLNISGGALRAGELHLHGDVAVSSGGGIGSSGALSIPRGVRLSLVDSTLKAQLLSVDGSLSMTASRAIVNLATAINGPSHLELISSSLSTGSLAVAVPLTIGSDSNIVARDLARIGISAPLVVSGGSFRAGSLESASPIRITAGALRVAGLTRPAVAQSITLDGGLFSTGSLLLSSGATFAFQSGTFELSGSRLVIGANGLFGSNVTFSSGRHLRATGSASIDAGARLHIASGGSLFAQRLRNSGLLSINNTSGTLTSNGSNSGIFIAKNATLDFGIGTDQEFSNLGLMSLSDTIIYGDLRSDGGSTINFAGDVTFDFPSGFFGGAAFTGLGNVTINDFYSPGDSAGLDTFNGNLTLAPTSTLNMELGGAALDEHDRIHIMGHTTLDGAIELRLINSFVPQPGDVFELLTYGSGVGSLSLIRHFGFPGLILDTTISPNATMITASAMFQGDANYDARVDEEDLGILAEHWHSQADWLGGDFDQSGFVDLDDLYILASNWMLGVSGAEQSGTTAADLLAQLDAINGQIPEPACGFAICAAGLARILTRRRSATRRANTTG